MPLWAKIETRSPLRTPRWCKAPANRSIADTASASGYRDRPSTTRFCRAAGLRRRAGAGASTWAREPSNWRAADHFVVPQLGIVRGARAAATVIVDHDAVGLGTGHDLAQAAGIEYDHPRGATDRKAPVFLEIRDAGGRRADQRRRIRQRMIEMQDADRLAKVI